MPTVELRWETWAEFLDGGLALMAEEYEEYARPLGLWKPCAPDTERLARMQAAGDLWIGVARVNGACAAYLFWTFGPDLESSGHWTAYQGLWFASKRFRKLGLGVKLMRWSLEYFRSNIQRPWEVDLHSMELGRGRRLDSLFRRLGARPLRTHWTLKLEPLEPLAPGVP